MRLQDKITAAQAAIEVLGGPAVAARKLNSLTGMPCSRWRVQKWLKSGIATPWHPHVHQLTNIPLTELDPEIYPAFLFE